MEGGPARWRKVSDAVAGFLRADGKLAPIYAAFPFWLLVSLKQELERLSPRELMIIRTYLDYPIEAVARKLKVRPNTVSKARRKIARELRKKLV